MKELSLEDLTLLNDRHGAPMVSIYLNKEKGVLEPREHEERWYDSISKAEFLLLKDYSRNFVDECLSPLRNLDFLSIMEKTDKGLVVFLTNDKEIFYLRTHSPFHDLTVVADSFHIKPLIKIKTLERGFFLVSMTSRAIVVFIEHDGQLLRLDSYRNDPAADGIVKRSSQEFFQHASQELNKLFTSYNVPIILAGVRDHIGHMKRLLPSNMLMNESIVGNVEKIKTSELRERVIEILQPFYHSQELKAQSEIEAAISKDKAIFYLEDIAVSAVYGKIRKLFVAENKFVWGNLDPVNGEIIIAPKQSNAHDDDILDDLCQIVLSKGGEVVVVKDFKDYKGHLAVAIVTDRSHLSYTMPQEPVLL